MRSLPLTPLRSGETELSVLITTRLTWTHFCPDTESRTGAPGSAGIVGFSVGPAHGFDWCWKQKAPPLRSRARAQDSSAAWAWHVAGIAGGCLSWSLMCILPESSSENDVIAAAAASHPPPLPESRCAGLCADRLKLDHSAESEDFSAARRAQPVMRSYCRALRPAASPRGAGLGKANVSPLKSCRGLWGILCRLNQNPDLLWLVVSATELMSCKYSPSKGRAEPLKPAGTRPEYGGRPQAALRRKVLESNSLRIRVCPTTLPSGTHAARASPVQKGNRFCLAPCILGATQRE